MKSFMCLSCVILAFTSLVKADEQVIPSLKWDDLTLELHGFVIGRADSKPQSGEDAFNLTNIRPTFCLTHASGFGLLAEAEIIDSTKEDANWLRQGYLFYKIDETWTVRAGRMFLSAGYWTTPGPGNLETTMFPREPWGLYGYALQIEGHGFGPDKKWDFMADIGTQSDIPFQDGRQLQKVEFSGRLNRHFTEDFSLSTIVQGSDRFLRVGSDFSWRPLPQVQTYGEVYAASSEHSQGSYAGGYVFARYELDKHIWPHMQLDWSTQRDHLIWTSGVEFRFLKGDSARIIADVEVHPYEPRLSEARLAIKFVY